MIRIERLEVRTRGSRTQPARRLLQPMSFEVGRGAVLGVFGPNGSGKSSLLKGVAGLLGESESGAGADGVCASGDVLLEAVSLRSFPDVQDRITRILYLGSDFRAPFDLPVRDLFELASQATTRQFWPAIGRKERERIEHVVEVLEISEFLNRSYPTLSDGERQLMMFARGLIQAPKVLVLDETFSKLDLDRLLLVGRILRRQAEQEGRTFLIASHDLNFLSEVSDGLLLLRHGEVLAHGPLEEVLTEPRLRELFPRITPRVVRNPDSGKRKILY